MKFANGIRIGSMFYYASLVLPIAENIAEIATRSRNDRNAERTIQIICREDPKEEIIVETGILLHVICHSDIRDLNHNDQVTPQWLEHIHLPEESAVLPLLNWKQKLVRFRILMKDIKQIQLSTQ